MEGERILKKLKAADLELGEEGATLLARVTVSHSLFSKIRPYS